MADCFFNWRIYDFECELTIQRDTDGIVQDWSNSIANALELL